MIGVVLTTGNDAKSVHGHGRSFVSQSISSVVEFAGRVPRRNAISQIEHGHFIPTVFTCQRFFLVLVFPCDPLARKLNTLRPSLETVAGLVCLRKWIIVLIRVIIIFVVGLFFLFIHARPASKAVKVA